MSVVKCVVRWWSSLAGMINISSSRLYWGFPSSSTKHFWIGYFILQSIIFSRYRTNAASRSRNPFSWITNVSSLSEREPDGTKMSVSASRRLKKPLLELLLIKSVRLLETSASEDVSCPVLSLAPRWNAPSLYAVTIYTMWRNTIVMRSVIKIWQPIVPLHLLESNRVMWWQLASAGKILFLHSERENLFFIF